ncbi:MAG: DUF3078 domain-containing protein [Saprospiraceae bacterium]|nr:DUF3078 domain-containing protein [Saprospiraceae bacterium]
MKQTFTTLLLVLFCVQLSVAQTEEPKPENDYGWKYGGGLGLDLAGTFLKNPRLGAGDNRVGIGGLVNLFANKKQAKYFWDNNASFQLSTQRIGNKTKDDGTTNPFQKNLDILRLGSRFGYKIVGDKIFAAIDGTAESQLLPTYVGNVISGVDSNLLSEFLAPARFALAPGIEYKPSANLSFFVAPASFNLIYVGNDDLAALAGQPLGNEEGKNNRFQLGYSLKAQYANKYYKDRVAVSSKVAWFADYRSSLNGNVLWQNALDIQIFKGLALGLFGDVFYDHFTLVQVEKVPEGTSPDAIRPFLGLKPAYTGGFLLKYNKIF